MAQAAPVADQAARAGLGGQRLRHARTPSTCSTSSSWWCSRSARALVISATTPGLGGLGNFGDWWTEPIVFQKIAVWTGAVGDHRARLRARCRSPSASCRRSAASSTGCGRERSGCRRGRTGCRYTRGTTRTLVDVAALRGRARSARLPAALRWRDVAGRSAGRLDPAAVAVLLGLLALLGLRDKVSFLAARPEVYGSLLIVFLFPISQPDRRLADRLPLHLAGARHLEAQPPLPVRRLGDDHQHALEPLAQARRRSLCARLPRGHAALAARGVAAHLGTVDGVQRCR